MLAPGADAGKPRLAWSGLNESGLTFARRMD